jgi:tRNA (guanine37-N1)-methyltransferase
VRFSVVSIFPEMFEAFLSASLIGKARAAGKIDVDFCDPRSFTTDKHRTVDDAPYGGGPGMVMKPEPLVAAIESLAGTSPSAKVRRILLTPSGAPLTQEKVKELAELDQIVMVCGRYEGVDQRVSDVAIDEEISVGDYVLTGGELGAMIIIDAVSRYVPGVLGDETSTADESFSVPLLEYPQYTRPPNFRGLEVPGVLTSGNHAAIAKWRREESLSRTANRRPDLLSRHRLEDIDAKLWRESSANWARRTWVVLTHYPVYDNKGEVVTSAVTNMDLHDIARSVATFGAAGYIVVTPVTAQREKVDRILSVWAKEKFIDNREEALSAVTTAATLEDAARLIEDHEGQAPKVITTSANAELAVEVQRLSFAELASWRAADPAPTMMVFGTSWGLSREQIAKSDALLSPVAGRPVFNHLSVRGAVAVVLDRLLGVGAPPRS